MLPLRPRVGEATTLGDNLNYKTTLKVFIRGEPFQGLEHASAPSQG